MSHRTIQLRVAPTTSHVMAVQREPFLIFFPLGLLFGWLGVLHWIFYATGLSSSYSGAVHATLEIECFETAFAAGFLLTALPRRTASAPPSRLVLVAILGGLVFAGVAGLSYRPGLAALGFTAALLGIAAFALARLLGGGGAERRPPPSFVLMPIGLSMGILGGLLSSGLFELSPSGVMIAGDLIRQGLFSALIVGVGGLLLPLVFGHPPPPDVGPGTRRRSAMLLGVGILIFLSIILEHTLARPLLGTARGVVVLLALIFEAGIHRRITLPGTQRRVVRLAAWSTPLGIILAGLFPEMRTAWLHLTFISGYALLTLAVGAHVFLGHTHREALRDSARAPVLAYASLMFLAASTRIAADFFPEAYFSHLAYAGGAWIIATLFWGWLVTRARARDAERAGVAPAS